LDGVVENKWIERHRSALVAAAAAGPLLTCAGLAAFRESVTTATAALVLVLIVIAVASTGDRLAGIVAALSAGAWFDVFLTEPYLKLTIDDPNDIEVTVLLVLVGVAVTEIALWGRRQQAGASRREGYLDGVLGTSKIITVREGSPDALIKHVAHQIVQVLDIDDCLFVQGNGPGPQAASVDRDGRVTHRGYEVNVERDGLPTDERVSLLVRHGGATQGQFVLTAASRVVRPSVEQLRVAGLLADQVGAALAHAD
jgi:K+-sensing histidine kinase KdpD